jgi:hypothetical protein
MSPWSAPAILLVLLMAVGSVLMWVGLPLLLVWLASRLADSPQAALGPYLVVLVGLPVGMLLIGKALAVLDRAHGRLTGNVPEGPQRAVWLESMRGDRERRRRRSVLDAVMVLSVLACVAAMAVWFFAFAGSSLPGA